MNIRFFQLTYLFYHIQKRSYWYQVFFEIYCCFNFVDGTNKGTIVTKDQWYNNFIIIITIGMHEVNITWIINY